MKAKPGIKRYSLDELRKMRGTIRPDAPIGPDPPEAWWKTARVVLPPPLRAKRVVTIRLDGDMVEWFRAQGRGHQTRMNAVLRSFYEAQKGVAAGPTRSAPTDRSRRVAPTGSAARRRRNG